jgi:outer membrane cobalamin receptor
MYDFSSSSEEDNDNEIPRRRRKMYRPRINWEFDSQFEYKEVGSTSCRLRAAFEPSNKQKWGAISQAAVVYSFTLAREWKRLSCN